MIANDFASAEKYADSIFNLTQKLEDPITALGYYFSIKAGVEKQRGLYINALKYYLEFYSLTIQRYKTNSAASESTDRTAGYLLSEIGNMFYSVESYGKALLYYGKSLEIFKNADNHLGLSLAINNIGLCYEKLGMPDSALVYYNKSLLLRAKINDGSEFFLMGHSMVYIGRIKALKKDYKDALAAFTDADRLLRKASYLRSTERLSENYYEMAKMYESMPDRENYLKFIGKAVDLASGSKLYALEALYYRELGEYYFGINDYTKAVQFASKSFALAEKNNMIKMKAELSSLQHRIFRASGKNRKANYWLAVSESLQVKQNREFLQVGIESFDKILEGRVLVYDNIKELEKTKFENAMLVYSGTAGLLLILAGAGIFVYYRRKRKEYETEILAAKSEAVYANQMKDRFLAGVSHEIRTPLNSVINFSETIIKDSADETAVRYSRIISKSGRSLLKIVNDILDASKVAAGKFTVNNSVFSIGNIVDDVITVLLPKSEKNENRIVMQIDPAMPGYLYSDPALLRQILLNLTGNAVKYTRSGSIAIRIGDVRSDGVKVDFSIRVEDSGIGMTEEELARIYDIFYQVKNNSHEGSGLGLSIARHFTELLGGEITVSSVPGKGSSFILNFKNILIAEADTYPLAAQPVNEIIYTNVQEERAPLSVPGPGALSSHTLNIFLALPLDDLIMKIDKAVRYNDFDSANEITSVLETAAGASDSVYLKQLAVFLRESLLAFDYQKAAQYLDEARHFLQSIIYKQNK